MESAGALGLAAEVEIVEMEIEMLVEAERLGVQGLALDGEEHAVQQAHLLPTRSEYLDPLGRKTASMADDRRSDSPVDRA